MCVYDFICGRFVISYDFIFDSFLFCFFLFLYIVFFVPDWLARSGAPPPGMRPVAGSIVRPGNILSWRLVMK